MANPRYYDDVIIYQTDDEQQVFKNELDKVTVDGDVAEVGVFQGGTALMMREAFPDRDMYLFDTFEGFADELHESDPTHYSVGDCAAPIEIVEGKFKGDKKTHIIKGTFPDTSDIIKDKKFAFVHIDVDIYTPTVNALKFFYPRMVIGGTIIVHDYPAHSGVKKAIDEFYDRLWTPNHNSWKIEKKDPVVASGSRQFIIYRRVPELTI